MASRNLLPFYLFFLLLQVDFHLFASPSHLLHFINHRFLMDSLRESDIEIDRMLNIDLRLKM